MITLHILQLLSDNGFGTIDTDLFWEKLPLNATGVAIISRGGPLVRGRRMVQSFDLYSRGIDDIRGADILEKMRESFTSEFAICDLPTTAKSLKQYQAVRLYPVGNIENLGLDETDRLLWRLSCEAVYHKV